MSYGDVLYLRRLEEEAKEKSNILEKKYNKEQVLFCEELLSHMEQIPRTRENVKKRFVYEKEFVKSKGIDWDTFRNSDLYQYYNDLRFLSKCYAIEKF